MGTGSWEAKSCVRALFPVQMFCTINVKRITDHTPFQGWHLPLTNVHTLIEAIARTYGVPLKD